MKVNKKITAMLLSAVIAAAPAAAPIMDVHGAKIINIIMTKMVRRSPV